MKGKCKWNERSYMHTAWSYGGANLIKRTPWSSIYLTRSRVFSCGFDAHSIHSFFGRWIDGSMDEKCHWLGCNDHVHEDDDDEERVNKSTSELCRSESESWYEWVDDFLLLSLMGKSLHFELSNCIESSAKHAMCTYECLNVRNVDRENCSWPSKSEKERNYKNSKKKKRSLQKITIESVWEFETRGFVVSSNKMHAKKIVRRTKVVINVISTRISFYHRVTRITKAVVVSFAHVRHRTNCFTFSKKIKLGWKKNCEKGEIRFGKVSQVIAF